MNLSFQKIRGHICSLILLTSFIPPVSAQAKTNLSDAQIKKILIQESLASYSGPCPCPENLDRRGHYCGKRSAYSRPGGASPLCYDSDVTSKMIEEYKSSHKD